MSVFLTFGTRRCIRTISPEEGPTNITDLLSSLPQEDALQLSDSQGSCQPSFYVLCNGQRVGRDCELEHGKSYHIVPRLLGGKGGFGSMLRAIGAQIEKTTSREACRDLSGRRMRDINNEKQLKEWLAKEAEREREREERKQERLARRLGQSQHKFDDAQYHEQRVKVQEDLQDALQKGLKRAKKNDPSESSGARPSKKSKAGSSKELLGIDIDSDDLQSDSDNEANPGSPGGNSGTDMQSSASSSDNSQTHTLECHSSNAALNGEQPVKEESNRDLAPNGSSQNSGTQDSNTEVKNEVTVKEEVVDSNEPVDLENYSSTSELVALGLERLKNALIARGLKCGGTLDERAARLFSVKGLSPDEIDPSLFAKSKGKGKKSK